MQYVEPRVFFGTVENLGGYIYIYIYILYIYYLGLINRVLYIKNWYIGIFEVKSNRSKQPQHLYWLHEESW